VEIIVQDPSTGREIRTNPARDIAIFWPTIVAAAADIATNVLEGDSEWPRFFTALGLRQRDVLEVVVAYCRAMERFYDPSVNNILQALHMTGFFMSSCEARLAFLACLGLAATSAFFAGTRSQAREVPFEVTALVDEAKRLYEELQKNPD
jgi:hypothetical protein